VDDLEIVRGARLDHRDRVAEHVAGLDLGAVEPDDDVALGQAGAAHGREPIRLPKSATRSVL